MQEDWGESRVVEEREEIEKNKYSNVVMIVDFHDVWRL